jgi:hypothetical protein
MNERSNFSGQIAYDDLRQRLAQAERWRLSCNTSRDSEK